MPAKSSALPQESTENAEYVTYGSNNIEMATLAAVAESAGIEPARVLVLPLSGSEPIPNLNRTRTEPQFRFRHRQRTGPDPRCGSGFKDCWIFLDLSEHVQTCANLKFSVLQITIFAEKKITDTNLLRVNRDVVTALEPKGKIK
jgi:hypothetical protein